MQGNWLGQEDGTPRAEGEKGIGSDVGKCVGGKGRSRRHSHWVLKIFLTKQGVGSIAKVDRVGDSRM